MVSWIRVLLYPLRRSNKITKKKKCKRKRKHKHNIAYKAIPSNFGRNGYTQIQIWRQYNTQKIATSCSIWDKKLKGFESYLDWEVRKAETEPIDNHWNFLFLSKKCSALYIYMFPHGFIQGILLMKNAIECSGVRGFL